MPPARSAFAPALAFALALLAPTALAKDTLGSLEEPHAGVDKVWAITVLPEEAGKPRPLIFRNGPASPFNLTVYDAEGGIAFAQTGTRGFQTLPSLRAGDYRFFVRGPGEFQVPQRYYANKLPEPRVEGALTETDAYALVLPNWTIVAFEGDASAEWWDLTAGARRLASGGNATAAAGVPYVLTIRGDEGAAYTLTFTPTEPHETEQAPTPGPGIALVVLAFAAIALGRARTSR